MSHLRDFGLISTTLWQSECFTSIDALDARLAYIWLHTGQKTCAGVMRIGPAHLFEEVDFVGNLERASEIFCELSDADLISWQRPYTIIKRFLRHNPVTSYRHAIGAFKEVLAMPDCDAKTELMRELQKHKGAIDLAAWRSKSGEPHDVLFDVHQYLTEQINPIDTPSEPLGNPSGISTSKNIKEKGEGRTAGSDVFPIFQPGSQDQPPDVPRNEQGPTEATRNSRLANPDF